jgi:hypothetical protein
MGGGSARNADTVLGSCWKATMMIYGSSYLVNDAPTSCAHCRQPFAIHKNRVQAWRSSTGAYFCNEFCADDDEVSAWKARQTAAQHLLASFSGT